MSTQTSPRYILSTADGTSNEYLLQQSDTSIERKRLIHPEDKYCQRGLETTHKLYILS